MRFHVLANSDSEKDQALKMKVKEAVLAYMEYKMPQHTDLAQTREWVGEHLGELGDIAQAVICGESYDYPVHLELTTSYFRRKLMGTSHFRQGNMKRFVLRLERRKGITGGVSYIQISVLLMQFMQSSRKMERRASGSVDRGRI